MHEAASFDELRAIYSTSGSDPGAFIDGFANMAILRTSVARKLAFDASSWDVPAGNWDNVARLSRDRPQVRLKFIYTRMQRTAELTWTPTELVAKSATDRDFRLKVARTALKAAGFTDRVVQSPQSQARFEYVRDGVWTELAIDSPPTAAVE